MPEVGNSWSCVVGFDYILYAIGLSNKKCHVVETGVCKKVELPV